VSACVLDTDVVIGALDRQDAHHAAASETLLRMIDAGVTLHLCVINYAEALVRPAQHPDTLTRAIQALGALSIKLESPDPAVARDAARLRSMNISLADGFALATARRLSATLATFDARARKAATQLAIATIYA